MREHFFTDSLDATNVDRWLREALRCLNSPLRLSANPMAGLLGHRSQPRAGDALRRSLIDAIEQLKPIENCSTDNPGWREYRHLVLRYIEGMSRDQVADTLGVSTRQASRDHERAIGMLVEHLRIQFDSISAERCSTDAREYGSVESPESGAFSSPKGDVERRASLSDTLDGARPTLETLAGYKGIALSIAASDTLPAVALSQAILRQAILNLCGYAIQIALRTVMVSASDTPEGITLTIDTERLCDVSQVIPTSAPAELADMLETGRQLLQAQGGRIQIGALGAEGPLLTLILPPISLRQVLVIDDNIDIIELFRRYLRGKPYRLIQATSGESALRLAQEYLPDMIILDVMLPTQDGWDILRQLRSSHQTQHIPVIVCSILPMRALAHSLGVQEFLAKPVTRESLVAALDRNSGDNGATRTRR